MFVTKNDHFPLSMPEAENEPPARPCQPQADFGLVRMRMREKEIVMMIGMRVVMRFIDRERS